jgi:DNA-binding transcriptional regulator YiaG
MTASRKGKGIHEIFSSLEKDEKSFAESRFWNKVEIKEKGCWEWGGHIAECGYGEISISGVKFYTHRFSAYIRVREDISESQVNHKCDNKICVRPSHHYLGTAKENMQDIIERGNIKRDKKVSDDEVEQIRERALKEEKTQQEIADEFGISQSHVSKIKNREKR